MSIALLAKKTKEINKVVLLPLIQIDRNPHQPRKIFDESSLQELCSSIAMNGLLQPITVRRLPNGRYELVAGERRTLAYKALGREEIPAIVEEYSDRQSAVLALVENMQRKDLNYIEEAYAISKLIEETNIPQHQICGQLGMAQSTVANKLRLLKLPVSVKEKLITSRLTERHARALLKISDEEMLLDAIEFITEKDLNVQQTEKYISDLVSKKGQVNKKNKLFVVKDIRIFVNSINKAVSIMNMAGLSARADKYETEEYLEYIIRIPKNKVYR